MKFFKGLFSCISVSKYLAEQNSLKEKNICNDYVNYADKLLFKMLDPEKNWSAAITSQERQCRVERRATK